MKLASVPFRTLLRREVERFMSVPTQTVFTPLISALLYLLIFGVSLGNRISFHDLPYTAFLIPGLVMMGVLNHSFQNTASSIMMSKFEGNIVEILSIGNDITYLKEIEKEIQKLNNELEMRIADRTRQLTEVNKSRRRSGGG